MRILLTNDDGIGSPGLHALAASLATLGEVVVVAPASNQSAVARSITLRRDLVVTDAAVPGAATAFSVDGTPVDCVRFGVIGVGGAFDAVVAGANLGHNLGDDVTYSGTVAAAFEGLLLGIPSFAISQGALDGGLGWTGAAGFDFALAARFTARLVAASIAEGFAPGTLLNVNVPARAEGVAVARLGRRVYRDALELVADRGSERVFRLYGGVEVAVENDPDTDIAVVASRRIAITPLHLDLAVREVEHLAHLDLDGLLYVTFVDLHRHDPDRLAFRTGAGDRSYGDLAAAAGAVARAVAGARRVAVEAHLDVATVVAILGARAAGAAVIPVNPKSGERERAHVLADAAPDVVLGPGDVDLGAAAPLPARTVPPEEPALIVYTSGTTGLPKGVVLADGALAANVDAIAEAWAWTGADRVAHALPLFHVHGLVLGTLAPLRLGGASVHVGRFEPAAVAAAVADGATMVFGVPTMWSRIAAAAEGDAAMAAALGRARLLVSGSAGLPLSVHARLAAVLGRRVVERYGMTETLFSTAERADTEAPPGSVGPPVGVVELRLVDDEGAPIEALDDETLGEVQVRGRSLFSGYLNAPAATAAAFTADGWFRTGDIAARRRDGSVRIVGRRATDLIKSGGYRIGAGEIETALLDHPAVAEVAVTGEPDDELGERIVAWVVPAPGTGRDAAALVEFVARELTPHKRPREVRYLDALPRNELGKVLKRALPR